MRIHWPIHAFVCIVVVLTATLCQASPIIIDDGTSTTVDPNVALVGTWNYRPESGGGAKPGSWNGTGSRFAVAGGDVETATYTPNLPTAGAWQVDLWWPTFGWTSNALVEVHSLDGTSSYRVNQSINSAQWNPMGMYQFGAGTAGNVVISSAGASAGSNGVGPVADAVRFTPAPLPWNTSLSFQEGVSPNSAYTTDGTHIRADVPDTSSNGHAEILTGTYNSNRFHGMLSFDLSMIEALSQGLALKVDSVQLVMYTHPSDAGSGSPLIQVREYAFPFDEETATWSDPDGDGNPATGDATPGGTLGAWLSELQFNASVTGQQIVFGDTPEFRAAVEAALASSDNTLRLLLKDKNEPAGTVLARFVKDESSLLSMRPQLLVTFSAVPEPGTFVLLGLGGVGLAGVVLRRRSSRAAA